MARLHVVSSVAGLVIIASGAACGGPRVPPASGVQPSEAPARTEPRDPTTVARSFVETLAKHDWEQALRALDRRLTSPAEGEPATARTLEAFWKEVAGSSSFQQVEGVAAGRRNSLDVLLVVCRFSDKVRFVRVSLGESGRVAGLFLGSATELAEPDARTLVEALAAHDIGAAHAMLAPSLRARVSEQDLAAMWGELERDLGAFEKIEHVEVGETPPAAIRATVSVKLAKGTRDFVVGFDENADVVGLKISLPSPSWEPPSYAKPTAFAEKAIAIGSPELPGFVTLPVASAPVPAVVLVHRDGPQDADETIGAIRPFKDLAWGLASRGIAVLRYKKRTLGEIGASGTEKDETIAPALAAVEALRTTPGIDASRIVVVGHGRGGALAPIIAREAKLKGAALLAAPVRGLAENVVEQLAYLASLDPKNADLKAQVDAWKNVRARVDDPSLDRGAKIALPSGGSVSGAYFVFARELAPVQAAAKFPGALFVAQGSRDFQVSPGQLGEWQKAVGKAPKATFKTYRKLTHLFTPSTGSGRPGPSDYEGAIHVDEQVIVDLAAWITKL